MKNKAGFVFSVIFTVYYLVLFTLFLTLKLCGVIGWRWVWVFAPLWAFPAAFIALICVLLIIYAVVLLVQRIKRKRAIKKLEKDIKRGSYEN